MKQMLALRNTRLMSADLAETNSARVLEPFLVSLTVLFIVNSQMQCARIKHFQALQFLDCATTLYKHRPALNSLRPYMKIGVNTYHNGAYAPIGLKNKDINTVEE